MKISISLIEQAPVGRAHLSGPRTVQALPWTIKGRVHPLEGGSDRFTRTQAKGHPSSHNQYNIKVDVGYYALAARTTLNPCVFPAFICSSIKRS
jgi:hypothetical protein